MKRSLFTLAAFVCLAALAAPSYADKRTHAAAQVSIDVPDGWKVEAENDNMTVTDPDEDVGIFFLVLETDDLQKALEAIDSEVGKIAKDLKWDAKPSETKLNGMNAVTLEGKGKIEGKPADLGVMLVNTPADKILLVLGALESSKAKKHEAAVDAIIKSIKPAK